jgi:hypothetical protein
VDSFSWKFVVLSAVSTEDQATEDKDSLEFQYKTARAYGERMGGTFTREYRADGFSRSGWYDLTMAFDSCQAFEDMAYDARAHSFDVLIVESFDRLGDLSLAFFNYFASLGEPYIQMNSVQHRLIIEDPTLYHPRKDDATTNAIADALKFNKSRTNKSFRAFSVGNSRRARDGKYSIRVPMGYLRTDDKEAIIDPVASELIAQIPVWYLGGLTVAEIQRKCEASGVNPGRGQWSHKRIIDLLVNPFYAGRTFYDLDKNGQLYEGKHEPLWTYETHECILAEMERRRSRPRQKRNAYNFTSLLTCSECGKHLQIGYDSKRTKYKYWSCAGHVTISTRKADKLVADEMRRIYANAERTPVAQDGAKDFSQQKIKQVRFELKRLEEAYFHGAYNPQDYTKLKLKLESDLNKYQDEQRQKRDHERKAANRQRAELTMQQILPHIDTWLSDDDPKMVNYTLGTILTFTVHPDKRIVAERIGIG